MAAIQCGAVRFTNVQAVIFDKDGTLADVETFLCSLARRRLRLIEAQIPGVQTGLLKSFGVEMAPLQAAQTGYSLDPAGLMAVGSRQENAIAAAAYVTATGQGWVHSLNLVQEAFQAADRSPQPKATQTPLLPGTVPLLQKLTQAGIALGILSSDSQNQVDDFIATYQLNSYFQAGVGVQGNLSKFDPELWQQIFCQLKTAPGRTLMIGDSQLDIQIAKAAQMLGCIGFTGGWSSKPSLMGANVLVDRLEQIQVI